MQHQRSSISHSAAVAGADADPHLHRKTPLAEPDRQGRRTLEDRMYGLDPEPIHIVDDQLRPFYRLVQTRHTFARGWGFQCPVCGLVMHDGHRGARAFRAHLMAGGVGGCAERPAKDRSQQEAKLESFRS